MCIDNYTSCLKSYQDDCPFRSCNRYSLLKRPKVLVQYLMFRRSCWKLEKQGKIYDKVRMRRLVKREMEIKNLKLYMANKFISDENEKLKRKATELLLENKILQFQLQNAGPSSTCHSLQ